MRSLRKEVAYIAYHFHWSQTEILEMEHPQRRAWIREIAEINRRLNAESRADPDGT